MRSRCVQFSVVSAATLFLANCASDPAPKRSVSAQNQREIGAFSDKRKYGSASPRVVSQHEAVPKGGGRDHVGKPYRVAGRWYTPRENPGYSATGMSSWYGDAFHGRKTANGEVYDKHAYTAAHPTMPLPSYARVTNTSNGHSIIVRVNDRGPFHAGRIIDVSERVAHALAFKHIGTARVKVDYVQRASTAGSDDRKLVATLRTDGQVAHLQGGSTPLPSASPILTAWATPRPTQEARPETRQIQEASPAPEAAPVVAYAASKPSDSRSETAEPVVQVAAVRRSVPLPPDRPFDLGTIPGAGVPIQRVNNGQIIPVQAAPARDRVAALYFAPPETLSGAFGSNNPMQKLRAGDFVANKSQKILAGSYRDKNNADRLAHTLKRHGNVKVQEVKTGEETRFRVTLDGFASESAATLALQATKAAGVADARLIR